MNNDVRRLEIAGLYTLSFFGYIIHMVFHNMLSHGMDPKVLAEIAETMKQPSMQIMTFLFTVLTVLPAFMAYILKNKTGWKVLSIAALIIMIINGAHAGMHMLQGDILNGGTTFVMQMIPGILALVWSFKYFRTL